MTSRTALDGDDHPPAHTHTPHGDAQRQALTRIAFHLIAEGGLERFRTREVAKRGGVNIATLHYYFPSKEDLIRSVVDYLSNEFATRQAPYSEPGGEPLAELRRELSDSLYQLHELPELFLASFELFVRAAHDPAIRVLMQEMDAHWHAYVVSYMSEGVRQGVFRADLDPAVAAWELIALVKGTVLQLTINPNDYPIEHIHAEIERWFTGNAGNARLAHHE